MKLEGPRQRPNLRMSLFAPGLLRGADLGDQHVAARSVVIGRVLAPDLTTATRHSNRLCRFPVKSAMA